jgi:putative membrane protein
VEADIWHVDLRPEDRYPAALLAAFAAIWVLLAIAPWYRQDWLLENLLVFLAVPVLLVTRRSLRFSNFAYTCFFVFLVFHEIGAHYTYSEVPWNEWFERLTGQSLTTSLGVERNHYDRVIHFLYGLLVFPMAWELFAARARPERIWRYLMPLLFIMSHSVIYELIEWAAAATFGGDLGQAYLGTQGDVWDAQKDMTLATLGAVLGLAMATWRDARRHPPRPS